MCGGVQRVKEWGDEGLSCNVGGSWVDGRGYVLVWERCGMRGEMDVLFSPYILTY